MKSKKHHIYADNAATTKIDPVTFDAMVPFLKDIYANPSSLHSLGKCARDAVESARQQIASCIGASPDSIVFTSGGTESDNLAINGVVRAMRDKGSHVIASAIEHHAVLNCCDALRKDGFATTFLPVDASGLVSLDALSDAIRPQTKFVSIMMANNEIGTIQDIYRLASITHDRGLIFHTDAVQAVGHIPVNVAELGVDLLSASAHKFNGPKGVGFLYIRKGVTLYSFMNGGQQEAGYRAGTENVAGIVGMACALKNHFVTLSDNINKLNRMSAMLASRISSIIPEARFNGHATERLPGLLSISFPRISAESLMHLLDLKGIFISTGAACNSKATVVSHVLHAIKLTEEYSAGTIRISLSKDNTESETVIIADSIVSFYSKLSRR